MIENFINAKISLQIIANGEMLTEMCIVHRCTTPHKFGAKHYLLRKLLCSQAGQFTAWNRMLEGDCVQTAF